MSTFDLRTPISAGRMKPLTKTSRVHTDTVEQMVRRLWPDLPSGSPVVMLPREDFEIILAATEGRPLLQTRAICDFTIVAQAKPTWWDNAVDIALKTWWIIWGVAALVAIVGAFQ